MKITMTKSSIGITREDGAETATYENGKEYKCKIWVENGLLKVRGYVMFLYRTQTWFRPK